jgi:transcriptional regulator with GAF, ATPase, and Fis domain
VINPESRTISQPLEPRRSDLVTQPFLFVVLHADDVRAPSSRHALGEIDEVQFRRGTSREAIRVQHQGKRQLVLTFPDAWMSGMHARLHRRGAEWFLEDAGSKNGTFTDGRRAEMAHLSADVVLEFGHTFLLFRRSLPTPVGRSLDQTATPAAEHDRLSTLSPELERTFGMLAQVASSAIPVLVRGETGTGKEVVAQELHRMSARRGALVAVNCGALPSTLVEAELFGFRRGSFSGAVEDRAGLVRAASSGTLFLDEIGDLSLDAQPALLRVLQEGTVISIGSAAPISVDFRLISATHRNLDEMTTSGTFREDLLSRLNGLCVRLPPLRDRREDLGILINQLLRSSRQGAVSFSLECARAILASPWRQNIRELGRRLSVGVVLAKGGSIAVEHMFDAPAIAAIAGPGSLERRPERAKRSSGVQLNAAEAARRDQLIALLREHDGNVTAVARAMGKARAQVQRWIRRYGLQRSEASAG